MKEDEEKYHGNGLKFVVQFSVIYMVLSILRILIFQKSRIGLFPSMIPLFVIIFFYILTTKKWDIFFRKSGVEGPSRKSLSYHRVIIPYQEIDMNKTRAPSFWRRGYIEAKDGSRIVLNYFFFNRSQMAEIMEKLRSTQRVTEADRG